MDLPFADESTAPAGSPRGLQRIRELLRIHPKAGVAVIDAARDFGDARALLEAAGVDIGTHPILRGTAAAEFVAPADISMVSSAFTIARADGEATRTVHLRDGQVAALHLIRVDELQLSTGFVMVIVPASDGAFAETPALSTVEAAARVGVVYVDGYGVVTTADAAVLGMLRQTRSEVEGSSVINFAHPDEQEASIAHWVTAKENRGLAHRWRSRLTRGDGSLFWAEITLVNRIDDAGEGDVRVEFNDISREVAAAEELAAERELLKQLTETLPVGVAKFDADGAVEYSNARLTHLLGRDPAGVVSQAIAGRSGRLSDAFLQLLREGRPSCFVSPRDGGLERDLEWTLRPVSSAAGNIIGGVLCVADVTEATELRAALEERATTDALTGCLNWTGTVNCLQTELMSASPVAGVGLLFIDLDGFKGINDSHGHAIGDRVLEIVANRLRSGVRPLDRIGRLGGDEFVVIAPGLRSLDGAQTLAGRVAAELNDVAAIGDLHINISASIGVAWADSGDADELLAEADKAMYAVKSVATTRSF